MKVHIRVHTNDRPYHCPYKGKCNQAFKTKSQLSDHILKHTQIKNFQCPECRTCFARKSRLKIHMMIHKGEKPFECIICTKKFREKANYNFHMKKHIIKNEENSNKIKISQFDLKNDLNKVFNKNHFLIDKKINDFNIKVAKEEKKSFDNNSTNNISKENTINNNDNIIIENKIFFPKKEINLNSEIFNEMNNIKVFNDLIILNNNININMIKFNYKLNKEKNFLDENEFDNNFIYQNQNFSLFNEQKDLYNLYNCREQNKCKNLNYLNNSKYYDDLYIDDIFNLKGIMFQNNIVESEFKNKISDEYYYQDFPLNFKI